MVVETAPRPIGGELPTRDQIAIEDTWDLTTLYADDQAWEQDLARVAPLVANVVRHRGSLGASPQQLKQAIDDEMLLRETLERVRVYTALRKDEDTANPDSLARYERSVAAAIEASEALAFFEPELLSLPEDVFADLVKAPELATYRHMLENLARRRAHVRSLEVEEVLAQNADIARAASEAFGALDNADLRFGLVTDDHGHELELTKARHGLLLRSPDRETRRRTSETFTNAYLAHRHTLASLYASSVRGDVFQARVRNYGSAREAALFSDNVPLAVYDNLVASVRNAQPVLARDLQVRSQLLKIDDLHSFDLVTPLSAEPERRYTYREGVEIVLNGLGYLGEAYVSKLRQGFNSRWVDVHETRGKRSGAYSFGAYAAPPVILMNWNGTLSDVFTLAHEAGHAMHTLLADESLPYHEAGYPIFLAEIASTVNEVLLTWTLLEALPEADLQARFAILDRFRETYFGTVVRQTMFAEFEQRVHALAEASEPLTYERLSDIYTELYADYSPGVVIDDSVRVNWARVPHFYRAFYVYQYATGLSAAIALASAIRDEGDAARDRYLGLLASGGRDYPMLLLNEAGVDLTSPAPIDAGLAEFARVLAEMERMAASGKVQPAGA